MLKIINSRDEMFKFIKDVYEDFKSPEDHEYWFGYSRRWDCDGNPLETLDEYVARGKWFFYVPDDSKYPVVINYINEESRDRYGKIGCAMWDWISIKEIV